MTDAALKWNARRLQADLALTSDGWELQGETGLETAVIISLFTDRWATEEELPAGERDRRGSWQDAVDDDGDETGSLIWLLEREKATDENVVKLEHYASEALAWMIEDGVAKAVDVEAERDGECLGATIAITRPDGSRLEYSFADITGVQADAV